MTVLRYIRRGVAGTVLAIAALTAQAADPLPAPSFSVAHAPVLANAPFDATFQIWAPYASFGIDEEWTHRPVSVSGDLVTVAFDFGCGFICPGGAGYLAYPFKIPALAAGRYRVRFVDVTFDSTLAEFPLAVENPNAVPALHLPGLLGLIVVLGGVALARLRRSSLS